MAVRSHTSATATSTRSPPNSSAIAASLASSRSVSTTLAPLACSRCATSTPIPPAPPVIMTVLPATPFAVEPMRRRYNCTPSRASTASRTCAPAAAS
ncbi:Uncharacterised protein [Mycobacteroides abscessus subsp. abscessus]|nr:Uncharacterised protein [Mycobacteroides abscessus subsp. abscessus]